VVANPKSDESSSSDSSSSDDSDSDSDSDTDVAAKEAAEQVSAKKKT
jgi:hypothetical protein